jgi:hypothetical protein
MRIHADGIGSFLEPKETHHGEPAVVGLERGFALGAPLLDLARVIGGGQ